MPLSRPCILFLINHLTPITYHRPQNTYYLCPNCLVPDEVRYCSGRTKIGYGEFGLCAGHCETLKTKPDTFDPDDILYFRDLLRDGTLKRDFTFGAPSTRQGIRHGQKPHRDENWRRDNGLGLTSQNSNIIGNDTGNDENTDAQVNLGSNSDATSGTVEGTDNTRKVSETPSSPSHDTSPTSTTPSSLPHPKITYAHSSHSPCLHSPSPVPLILPPHHPHLHRLTKTKLTRLAYLRQQYDLGWGYDEELKEEHAGLLGELGVSLTFRGWFWRRCNGEMRNVVGELLEVGEGVVDDDGERSGSGIGSDSGSEGKIGGDRVERAEGGDMGRETGRASGSESNGGVPLTGQHNHGSEVCSTDTTTAVRDTEILNDTHLSPYLQDQDADVALTDMSEQYSMSAIAAATTNAIAKKDDSSNDSNRKKLWKPAISNAFLEGREELVRLGLVSAEDLIVSCWGMNSIPLS